jgi:hypothetical protein
MIDRIGITAILGDQGMYSNMLQQLDGMAGMQDEILPDGKIIIRKHGYRVRLDYYPEYSKKKAGRRKILDISIGCTKNPKTNAIHAYFTLTLYPSQFENDEFHAFKWRFDALFDPMTYSSLFQIGKVNYLELAKDSYSNLSHSFLPYQKYVRDSLIYTEKSGHLGTTYLGSVKSYSRFRIYDKKRQLLAAGKKPYSLIFPHTRIEAVLRRTGLTPAMLATMKNPFEKLLIADLAKAKEFTGDCWQKFLVESLSMGVPKALQKFPEQRKKFLSMLDSIPVQWWMPENLWSEMPAAINRIAP